MSWRRELRLGLFPVLAAVYPVLVLAAGNSRSGAFVGGFGRAVAGAAAAGAAAWALSALLTRDPDRRTLAAVAAVAWFSGFGLFARAARGTLLEPRAAVLAASLLLLAAAAAWIARTRRALAGPARVLRMTVALVLAFPLLTLISQLRPSPRAAAAAPPRAAPADPSLPSIYLVILDKYSGTRSLAAYHGYDNRPFEARLRALGFAARPGARPNYPHTWLSIPSLLNWQYVDEIVGERPPREWLAALRRSVDENRTARFLRERGYEYVFVPSSFPFTQGSSLADRVVPSARRRSGVDVWAAWLAETPVRALARRGDEDAPAQQFPYPVESAREVERKLDAIAATADGERPRFVFAHLLMPHEPYVFHADCSRREPYWPPSDYGADSARAERAYLEQVTCLNRLLERMVSRIIERSAVPPVILLQADHGHAFMALDPMTGAQLPRGRLRPEQVEERLDAFSAYYLPGGGAQVLYDSMTAVNLIPAVLNRYLNAGIPLREDRVYWATLHPPFGLERLR